MSTNTSQAGFASAMAAGMTGLAEGISTRDRAKADRMKAQAEVKLMQEQDKAGYIEAQVAQATETAKAAVSELRREKTYKALRYYTEDGDVRHLNNFLRDDDLMKRSGIIRFDTINPEYDRKMLVETGLAGQVSEEEGDALPGFEDHGRFVKATMADGTQRVIDLYKVKQATGYFKDITKQQLEMELAMNEAMGKQGTATTWMRNSAELARLGLDTYKGAMQAHYQNMAVGDRYGRLRNAVGAEEALDERFNGDFLQNFDPSNPQHRKMAERDIEAIEMYRGIKWDSSDRKEFRDIATLLALGEPGEEMSEAETGMLDSLITDVRKYVTDTGGSEAVSAYAAFRNSLRHALYGSALTDSEIAAFNEQFGTRRQKLGPLLKQMKVAMSQVKAKIEAMANMENSYVAQFRLGISREQAEDIVWAMDQRINELERYTKRQDVKPGATPDEVRQQRNKEMRERLRGGS